MKQQVFDKYDLVRVDKEMPKYMSHFQCDCDAIVIGSYNDQFGGGDVDSFTIHIKGCGQAAWYNGCQLTLIAKNQKKLLAQWIKEEQACEKKESDLDWIFEHGKEVLGSASGAMVSTLAKQLGMTNLWGCHGEGFVYYQNAMTVLSLAEPYLLDGNKNGWLNFAKENFPNKN